MGLLFKTSDIKKSCMWHNIGYSIDPMNEENTVQLCSLYYDSGLPNKVLELNKNNLFDNFLENTDFLTIYARSNFQKLYYKNGMVYLLKIIEKLNKKKCVSQEDKIKKWQSYHDASCIFSSMSEHTKAIEYVQIAVKLSNDFNLDKSKKLLSFQNKHINLNKMLNLL